MFGDFRLPISLLSAVTVVLGGEVVLGGPQHQTGIAVFPDLVRLATLVVTSFHFFPTMPDRHQPLDPGSPQSPEHLESVRFFSSWLGAWPCFPFTAQHGFSGQGKGAWGCVTSSPEGRAPPELLGVRKFMTATSSTPSFCPLPSPPCTPRYGHDEGSPSGGSKV